MVTSAGSSTGWERVIVDVGIGVALAGTGIAARTSVASDGGGELLFRGDGDFSGAEVFFFFRLVGVGDFFLPAALALWGDAFGEGEGDLRGVGVGVGDGFLRVFDFFLADFDLALGVGVGLTDSARRVFDGVSSLVCARTSEPTMMATAKASARKRRIRARVRTQAACATGAGASIGVAARSRSRRKMAFNLPPSKRKRQVRYIQVKRMMSEARAR